MKFKISTSERFYITHKNLYLLKADYDQVVNAGDNIDLSNLQMFETASVACIKSIGNEYQVFVNRYQMVPGDAK